MGILKFAKLMTTKFASTMSSLLVGIREMVDNLMRAIIDQERKSMVLWLKKSNQCHHFWMMSLINHS